MATSTPWGPSQFSERLAPGIMSYSTGSHGGIHLSPARNAQVHPAWRRPDGWYEEDCDWAIVAFTFPALFVDSYAAAIETARNWRPFAYQKITGIKLRPEESYKLRERAFRDATRDRLVVVSCQRVNGSDMLATASVLGGRDEHGHYDVGALRYHLVPQAEYGTRGQFAFVIDEAKHQEVASF